MAERGSFSRSRGARVFFFLIGVWAVAQLGLEFVNSFKLFQEGEYIDIEIMKEYRPGYRIRIVGREATEDILLGKGMFDHYEIGDYATVVWIAEEPETIRFRKFPIGAAVFSVIMFGLWFWVKGIRTD
jgi:hypothetical protein